MVYYRPYGAAFRIAGRKPAAVFRMPGIGGQKPSSTDRALTWGMADRKPFKEIESEHPHKGDIVHTPNKLRNILPRHDRAQILHRQIDQRHPGRIGE